MWITLGHGLWLFEGIGLGLVARNCKSGEGGRSHSVGNGAGLGVFACEGASSVSEMLQYFN